MKNITSEIKCEGFLERKNTLLMLVAKSFPEARKDWRWKISPIEMGIKSNVDKPRRGETSCSTAQARGEAWMKIWVSWPQVRLHNLCMLPVFHPDPMCPLCHRSQHSGCEGRCGQTPLGRRVGSGCMEQTWPTSRY